MSDFTLDNSQNYFDVLRELGNIGAGNATTALSQMLNCKVDMMVPQVKLLEFKEIGEFIGGEEQLMAGVYVMVNGDIAGSMMFLLEQQAAHSLVSKLMMTEPNLEGGFSEMEWSALKEIGNIIVSSYLNSLATMTNMKIVSSVPDLNIDMAGALLSVPAIHFGQMGDKMLLIETRFLDEVDIEGYFILIPDLESYNRILASIGM